MSTPSPTDPRGADDRADDAAELRRLRAEVERLRGLLETERRANAADMAAGAAELTDRDERLGRQRSLNAELRERVQRLRRRAVEAESRAAALQAEVDRFRSMPAVRASAAVQQRLRPARDAR